MFLYFCFGFCVGLFLRLQALAGLDAKKPDRGGMLAWCNQHSQPKLIEALAVLRYLCSLRPGCQTQQLPVIMKLLEWCDRRTNC